MRSLTVPPCFNSVPNSPNGLFRGPNCHWTRRASYRKALFVNVTVENLAPCKKLVRFEVDVPQVDQAIEAATKDFQRQANLPGFRPGKAPVHMVLRKFEKDILDEAKRKLISDTYKKAMDEQKLEVLGYPDIEEIQFERGKPLQFAATIETAPEFEIPEYNAIPVKAEARTVTDADLEKALDMLRGQKANFNKVDRPAQMGDVAVVNYSGTSDGKPLTDIAPTAKGLTTQQGFWIEVSSQGFIPGFGEQLQGAKAGDKRTVNVDFPADFVTPALAGKKGVYEVEVVEVREKSLPELNDEFAKQLGAENVEKLKTGVREDLEREAKYKRAREVRGQIMMSLMNRVNFELPESAVERETRNAVYSIVQENAKRGVSRDVIETEKDRIYNAASQGAKDRVKQAFLLQKIAEKENVKVSDNEILQRINYLSQMYNIPADKFVKDLKKRNGFIEIYDQIMNEKVMDLLEKRAAIEDVPVGSTPPQP